MIEMMAFRTCFVGGVGWSLVSLFLSIKFVVFLTLFLHSLPISWLVFFSFLF
ncbi:hypothetical protein DFP73DRAFT_365256 [Morchella snyderi]|nr:hypothetical protein DFP73DRAFT_365256 [Morchella snyderi]